jgi:hypothetical protein
VVFAVQQDAAKQQSDYENKVLISNQMIKSLTEEIGSAERQAERSCPLYDPNHEDWVEHHNLIQKCKRKREELESLLDEMKKPCQVKNLVLQSLVKTVDPSSYGDLCCSDGDKKPKAKPLSCPLSCPLSRPPSRPPSCSSSHPPSCTLSCPPSCATGTDDAALE